MISHFWLNSNLGISGYSDISLVYMGATAVGGIVCSTSVHLPFDILAKNKTLTISSIKVNNSTTEYKSYFTVAKNKRGFYVYTTNATAYSACLNRIAAIDYTIS